MRNVSGPFHHIRQLPILLLRLIGEVWSFLVLCLRPAPALAAEVLFLCKQLAMYEERQVKPRRANNATQIAMAWLSHWFDWRPALRIVKLDTFTKWHRQGFCLFWRWKSRPGRPALPKDVQALIRRMALENPTWGQEREAIPTDHSYRILLHDRDAIFSEQADQGIRNLGLRVLKTPVRTPVANSICERVIGTMRRDCLDLMIPHGKRHLYCILKEWIKHYNESRPHMSLGPGMPRPSSSLPVSLQAHRHRLPTDKRAVARPVLSGLHHEDQLEQQAA